MNNRRTLTVGQHASTTRSFSLQEVREFARLSGDRNPLHLNPDFARQTVFGRPIVHGILVASLFSQLMAEEMPGPGSIYLGQTLNFLAPVYVDEQATATVEIIHIRPDKPIVTLRTVVTTGSGPVIMGEAVVKAPSGKSDSPA